MPESTLTPAPVNTATFLEEIKSTTRSTAKSSETGAALAAFRRAKGIWGIETFMHVEVPSTKRAPREAAGPFNTAPNAELETWRI